MFREIVGVMGMQLQKEIGLDLFYVVCSWYVPLHIALNCTARPFCKKNEGDVKLFETSRQLNKKSYSFLNTK